MIIQLRETNTIEIDPLIKKQPEISNPRLFPANKERYNVLSSIFHSIAV